MTRTLCANIDKEIMLATNNKNVLRFKGQLCIGTWTKEAFGVLWGRNFFQAMFKFFPLFLEPRGGASTILHYFSTNTLFMNYAIVITTPTQPQLNLIKPKLGLTWKWLCTPPPTHYTISLLLLHRFWPNFKNSFLGSS